MDTSQSSIPVYDDIISLRMNPAFINHYHQEFKATDSQKEIDKLKNKLHIILCSIVIGFFVFAFVLAGTTAIAVLSLYKVSDDAYFETNGAANSQQSRNDNQHMSNNCSCSQLGLLKVEEMINTINTTLFGIDYLNNELSEEFSNLTLLAHATQLEIGPIKDEISSINAQVLANQMHLIALEETISRSRDDRDVESRSDVWEGEQLSGRDGEEIIPT